MERRRLGWRVGSELSGEPTVTQRLHVAVWHLHGPKGVGISELRGLCNYIPYTAT